MKTINILIIDDVESVVKQIDESLKSLLKEQVTVFPKFYETSNRLHDHNNFLMDSILDQSNWDEIYEFYKDIDVFIIDQSLEGEDNDTIGVEFAEFILKKKKEAKIYLISSIEIGNNRILKNKNVLSVSKYGITNFEYYLVSEIAKNEGLILYQENYKDKKELERFQNRERVKNKFVIFVDLLISYAFILLILAISMISFFKLIYSFFVPKEDEDIKETTGILHYSEYIFLYLLPIFILFGFYVYYINNIRISFLGGKPAISKDLQKKSENSTTLISYTKIMFISSIISFIIVKLIEILTNNDVYDISKVITLGGLLIVLMVYFIFLERKH